MGSQGRANGNEIRNISIIIALCCMGAILAGTIVLRGNYKKPEIHPVVSKFLEGIHIGKSAVLSLGDYNDISYYLETPEITEEEIDEYRDELTDAYGMDEVTLDSIKDNFGLSSYDAFQEFLSSRVLNHKKIVDTEKCRQEVLGRLADVAKFDMDQDEVAKYSLEIVMDYETMAEADGLTIEEYCEQELQIPYDDFFDMCYGKGEQEIKNYLLIGAVAAREYGDVTEEMIKESFSEEDGEVDIYMCYQDLEHDVYDVFIHTEEGY